MKRGGATVPKQEPPQPAGPVSAAAPARILAVDDDERNLTALSELLSSIAEVVSVRSGEEALRLLLKDEFAVILLDVLMPGLDGYETASLIRKREQSKGTPIIFLTAINKEQAHMLRGYDAGAVDYVFKPIDPVMLRSKVSVFVELYEKTREIEQKAAQEQQLLREKLRAEQALRDSRQREDAILRSLPACFHARSITPPFAPRFVSEAVERLTGFPASRLTSEQEFALSRVHPDDVERLKRTLADAAQTGSYSCEFRWQCADGSYRHFLDQGVVTSDGDSSEPEIHGTLLDITDRHRLEDRLMHAERLDAIGKLTGGLAHDFNNLLAAVLSGLGLLERRTRLDNDGRKIIEMTRRSAQQGADLVNRMLAFSRRQRLHPAAVSLPTLAETINVLVAPVLGGLIRFEWRVDAGSWSPHADAAQLELALMNLIFNARDALPSGGTITVSAHNRTVGETTEELAAGDYVVIQVKDTGSGIAPELMSKVIEPFFTTKSVGKGTGLGLSTAYGFARQSGGTLRIDSSVGRGTTVALWLPRSGDAPGLVPAPSAAAATARWSSTGGSVLLVDDSAELRELTARALAESGFEVTTAAGGAEALALIEREPDRFDVIVTDFAMPLVSGLDVVRFARNLRVDWPAVIITGFADAASLIDRPQDVPLLVKPFDPAVLLESIGTAAARNASKAGLRTGSA
jgi:PAS domain S-box-containing protein